MLKTLDRGRKEEGVHYFEASEFIFNPVLIVELCKSTDTPDKRGESNAPKEPLL